MNKYSVEFSDNDDTPRKFTVYGENEKRAINFAQRLAQRKYGMTRTDFFTQAPKVEVV